MYLSNQETGSLVPNPGLSTKLSVFEQLAYFSVPQFPKMYKDQMTSVVLKGLHFTITLRT